MQKIKKLQYKEVRELITKAADKNEDRISFYEKIDGKLVSHTFRQLKEDIWALGTALLKRGFKDKHIVIIGENSYKWIISYLAVVGGVGVAIPLDKELYKEQIADLMIKGDVTTVIFSDTFINDMKYINENCNKVNNFICMNDSIKNCLTVDQLLKEGRKLIEDGDNSYDLMNVDPDALRVIMFTSGTTGANKGVMISQTNLLSNTEVGTELFKQYKRQMTILPFHHAYENVCGIFVPIASSRPIFINDSLKYLQQNMMEYKPDLITMVPIFLETIAKKIELNINKRHVAFLAKIATKWSNLLLKIGIDIRRLIFAEIHKEFGGKLKVIVCGGAPLRPELVKKYKDWGIRVINGFGISECTPLVAVNCDYKDYKAAGQVIDICDVKIDEPDEEGIGEVLVKGKNVMLGYYKDKKNTEASFIDGWFKTGDYGYLQGNSLYIAGRKKNLIVLSNGKNVHPEELEGYIYKEIPYVEEAIVYAGMNKKGGDAIIAAVYLNEEYLFKNNISNVYVTLKKDLRKLNRKLPIYKQIQDIKIQSQEFAKNSSKKIMRYKFLEGVK